MIMSLALPLDPNEKITPHFTRQELECKCGCGLLPSLFTAKKLERARLEGGGLPITLSSGARCRLHNMAEGGSPVSLHMYGLAADVIGWGDLKASTRAGKEAIMNLFNKIGFHVLDSGGCVHVDCRPWIPEVLKVR